MKKPILLLVPALLLLTSCDIFKVGYVNDRHSAGIEGGSVASSYYTEEYSYYAGDNIDEDNKNVATLTFSGYDENISDISDLEKLESYINCDVPEVFKEVKAAKNVGIKNDHGLFIGVYSSYADGFLSLSFNVDVKDIAIEASPYYYEKNAWNESELEVDDKVAVAVNTNGYITLSQTKNEEGTAIKATTCRYHLATSSADITIKVGQRRAFIDKITIYY